MAKLEKRVINFNLAFMKYLKITALLILAAFMACDRKPCTLPDCLTASSNFEPEDCPGNGTCTFEFYPDSKLVVTEENGWIVNEVKSGNKLVFHFEFNKHTQPYITDAGYSESIYFEVEPEGNTFLISQEDLEGANALFNRSCFCPEVGYFRITEGCIYGYKVNEKTWNISLNLTASSASSTYNRMKQHNFSRKTI
jgi:hypothetical protein